MRTDFEIICGDALSVLRTFESESVQCCVTSPPYFGLRDYGQPEQIGLEATPQLFVAKMVEVFTEVRRVLKADGTCWLNLGDSYAGSGKGLYGDGNCYLSDKSSKQKTNVGSVGVKIGTVEGDAGHTHGVKPPAGYKAKDLIGIPWRVAFALQEAGWWLRQDIIWSKPNPMPESVTDRCTKSHEYIFLLTKSAKYYYNAEAIREPLKDASITRLGQDIDGQSGSDRVPGKTNGNMKAVVFGGNNRCPDTRLQSGKEWKPKKRLPTPAQNEAYLGNPPTNLYRCGNRDRSLTRNRNGITGSLDRKGYEHRGTGDQKLTGHSGNFDANGELIGDGTANKKSVWTVATQPMKDAHFATFPEKLIEPCILAGSREGDLILDPFSGASTTGVVALKHRRQYIGIELNPEYIEISKRRLAEIQVRLF